MKLRKGAVLLALVACVIVTDIGADGTETLGPPSIPIQPGTGIVSAGTGMISQPGTITVEVPAGAIVTQVLLYWEGFMATNVPGDNTATVNGNAVTGTLIGGPAFFFSNAYASTFRADITSLNLVAAGVNSFTVSDLSFTRASNGAGVIVIFDDGSSNALIDLRDGTDLAFINFPEPRRSTVAQTFAFPASDADRTGNLNLFFASVAGSASTGGPIRPSSIELTTNEPGAVPTILSNLLDSNDGDEWDTFAISVDIPAAATTLTVQAFSRDDLGTGNLPASFDWLAAAFALEPELPPGVPGRMTGGGSVFTIDDVRVTRGFQIHCDLREPNNLEVNWPNGQKFHLTELTSAVCFDSPAVQAPPTAPFDTFIGTGVGKYNNQPGALIEFTFVDAGEPGTSDTARIVITFNNQVILDVTGDPNVPGFLDRGNLQAHKDNPPPGR